MKLKMMLKLKKNQTSKLLIAVIAALLLQAHQAAASDVKEKRAAQETYQPTKTAAASDVKTKRADQEVATTYQPTKTAMEAFHLYRNSLQWYIDNVRQLSADALVTTKEGRDLVHLVMSGSLNAVERLPDYDTIKNLENLRKRAAEILFLAARKDGHAMLAEFLVEAGVSPYLRLEKYGKRSPLSVAAPGVAEKLREIHVDLHPRQPITLISTTNHTRRLCEARVNSVRRLKIPKTQAQARAQLPKFTVEKS